MHFVFDFICKTENSFKNKLFDSFDYFINFLFV